MDGSIGERSLKSKGLMRAMGVVLDEPEGQVEIGLVDIVKANFGQGEPLILQGPIEAFEAGVVFGLADAGIDLLNAELAAGFLKMTGKFTAIIGVDPRQVSFG